MKKLLWSLLLVGTSHGRSLFHMPRDYAGNGGYYDFAKRQDNGPIQCSASTPCADASCCNSLGKCGYEPKHCKPTAPVTCTSNCNAVAMCGKYSLGGTVKCGLNLCCSYFGWCGTEPNHCINADPQGNTLPCQSGFGSCQLVPPPSCGTGSGTASGGRKIGYYQIANIRARACNKVTPDQLITTGFTQLNLAFASIDPSSFAVKVWDPADEPYYYAFTNLQTSTLKTWISVGGFDFSDTGPTHWTWSDLVSTAANRKKFIDSLLTFLPKYGFNGVDLDWEYPTAPERGGRADDPQNYVSLVREMRAAFGTKYGISLVLAPDYWYLRGMDPKSMEQYVDHFGFMSYDLHGAWDALNPTLGPKIRAQTDVREIYNDTKPLWFAKLDPAKINFGLAYYGRGYTVSNPSCATLGCQFSGPNKAARCTNFAGVMSNKEIQEVITSKGVQPNLLSGPMIKELKWDDQWIGYDDEETIAMKLGVANDLCMGGSMIWSVDFDSRISDTGNPNSVALNPNGDRIQPGSMSDIVTDGDSIVIVATGTQIQKLGTGKQYQYRYYGLRAGQTLDYAFLFEQDNEPLAVSKKLSANFDLSADTLASAPEDVGVIKAFGRRCLYNPTSGSAGSLSCSLGVATTGSNTASSGGTDNGGSPDNAAGMPGSSISQSSYCVQPSPSVLFCAPQNRNCGRTYVICNIPSPNLAPRGDPWGFWGPGDPGFPTTPDILVNRVVALRLRDISLQWMERQIRPVIDYESHVMLFYTRPILRIEGREGLSGDAQVMARQHGWLNIWDGWYSSQHPHPTNDAINFYDLSENGYLRDIRIRDPRPNLPQNVYEGSDQYYYFSLMSATYAMQARGTVIVMTDYPRHIVMEGIWGTVEYAILTNSARGWTDRQGNTHRNPYVDRIIAVSSGNAAERYVIYESHDPTVTPANPRPWEGPLPDRPWKRQAGSAAPGSTISLEPRFFLDPQAYSYQGITYYFDFFAD